MPTYKMVVDLAWTGSGSPGVNVFHFRHEDEGVGTVSLQDIVDAVGDFYSAIKGVFPTSLTASFNGELIRDPYGAPEYEPRDGWSTTGTGTNGYAPLASAIVVGWRSTSATRSGRGRTFISPLAGYCVDADGTPKSDVLAIVRNAAQALVDTSEGWTFGSLGIWSPTDRVLRDIRSTATRDTFAVLRSRRD